MRRVNPKNEKSRQVAAAIGLQGHLSKLFSFVRSIVQPTFKMVNARYFILN
jgi:hypothetical protein